MNINFFEDNYQEPTQQDHFTWPDYKMSSKNPNSHHESVPAETITNEKPRGSDDCDADDSSSRHNQVNPSDVSDADLKTFLLGLPWKEQESKPTVAAHSLSFFTSKNRKRPEIEIAPHSIGPITKPNLNDVLCGRGGNINANLGNVQFREIVRKRRNEYLDPSTKKLDKAHIAKSIVQEIRQMSPPGRFLKEDASNGLWYDVGDAKAIKKTGQALREGAQDIRIELDTKPTAKQKNKKPSYLAAAVTSNTDVATAKEFNSDNQGHDFALELDFEPEPIEKIATERRKYIGDRTMTAATAARYDDHHLSRARIFSSQNSAPRSRHGLNLPSESKIDTLATTATHHLFQQQQQRQLHHQSHFENLKANQEMIFESLKSSNNTTSKIMPTSMPPAVPYECASSSMRSKSSQDLDFEHLKAGEPIGKKLRRSMSPVFQTEYDSGTTGSYHQSSDNHEIIGHPQHVRKSSSPESIDYSHQDHHNLHSSTNDLLEPYSVTFDDIDKGEESKSQQQQQQPEQLNLEDYTLAFRQHGPPSA